jgi:hypothetical protein
MPIGHRRSFAQRSANSSILSVRIGSKLLVPHNVLIRKLAAAANEHAEVLVGLIGRINPASDL